MRNVKRLAIVIFVGAVIVGVLRLPSVRALAPRMYVQLLSSTGTLINPAGSAVVIASGPSQYVSVLNSSNQIVDSFGGGGGGGLTCTAGTTPVASGSVGCNTVTVSSAQLLAINGNPVTLVAAPGVGKLISVIAESATFAFSGSAYAGGSFPGIAYTNSNGDSASSGTFPTKSLITAAASSFETWTGITTPTLLTTANDVNQPIVFEDTANYTTGSGTLTISVLYTVVTP